MSKQQQNYEPILVKDPDTGQMVDIRPFFKFLDSYCNDDTKESIFNAKNSTEKVLRMMSMNISDETGEGFMYDYRNNMYFLYLVKDMFNGFTVYKKTN